MSNLILAKAFNASGAISPYRIVRITSADNVEQAAAVSHTLIGVNSDLTIASGERVEIMTHGIAWVEAGAAIAVGLPVTSDASGRGVAAAPAAGTNNRIIGFALEAAVAAGDQIRVLLSPGQIQG
ncbi:MAG: DUF2190 family protein [Roseomonas sp.]|nr:DUF2190 family protein [Roseomonas sp.]MCA3299822.1 DUF2190 family protein [Roseomonas sp.]MCA3342566.1 DUF2190 family protein [Roseomonas sp.]